MRNTLSLKFVVLLLGTFALAAGGCETEQGMTCGTGQLGASTVNTPPKHQYHYYPTTQVYRDCEADRWIWPSGESWKYGKTLPRSIDLGDEIPFVIELTGDDPAAQHASVSDQYPARAIGGSVNANAVPDSE